MKDCISNFENANSSKILVIDKFYLHHLIRYNMLLYHGKHLLIYNKYQSHFDEVRQRQEKFFSDGICRRTEIDDILYFKYRSELSRGDEYISFANDLQHSTYCCGMVNYDFFHRANIEKRYDLMTFHNKYRNEIHNNNKKIVRRQPQQGNDIYDYFVFELVNTTTIL